MRGSVEEAIRPEMRRLVETATLMALARTRVLNTSEAPTPVGGRESVCPGARDCAFK